MNKPEIISGSWNRVKNWVNKRIRIKSTGNTFVGEDSGIVTSGNYNNFMGYQAGYANAAGQSNSFIGYRAGYSNVGGHYNNFIGYLAGYSNITGHYNNFFGREAGYSNTTGDYNNFISRWTGYSNTTGEYNNFVGCDAGYSNTTGNNNTALGATAGYTNSTGHGNCFIGYKAGYYETGNYKLFIDDDSRTNEADGRIKALIYGKFATATANQLLRVNGILELTEISDYADNAAAIAGGLTTGQIYRNGDSLNIVH